MAEKKRNKKGIIALDCVLVAALITAGYSGYRLYEGMRNYEEADAVYDEIRSTAKPLAADDAVDEEPVQTRDWDALMAVNPDTAGWISLADSSIDYPVVYGSDNSWYLTHLFDGTYNPGGSIFVDYRNARGFTDRNTVIYGHHMNNDSMFNNVEKYKDPSYYESHKVLLLETPQGNYELHPVAGTIRKGTDDYVQLSFASEEEYQAYVHDFVTNSTFTSDETIGEGERSVLLSTCTKEIQNGRYALLCRLVEVS